MADSNRTTAKQLPPANHQRGFGIAVSLLAFMVFTTLLAQNVNEMLPAFWMGASVSAMLLLGYLVVFFKPLKRQIDTPYFAISSLLFIAAGTALGTFVTQNTLPEVFTQRYGETGSTVLRALQLDNVFHSWWYVGLYALLAGSLLKLSWRRKFNRANLGFHLAHLGPIIVLAGFWVDYFYGFRGIIQLETGENTNMVRLYQGNSNYLGDSTALPFDIRLDHFEFEKHDPDYRIQVWKQDAPPDPHAQATADGHLHAPTGTPEIVASFPLSVGKARRIYGTELHFRLKEFFPNFTFEYSYPEINDTIEARDPGILLELQTPMGKADLQLLSNRPGRNTIADPNHLGAWLEFYWEVPGELARALDGQMDAEWAETNRVIIAGKERRVYYLVDGVIDKRPLENGKFYRFPNGEAVGFKPQLLFPDAAYLKPIPATDGQELLNPVAQVEVWDNSWENTQYVYLYPGNGRRGGMYSYPESKFFLALESFKDRETKYYKSELSVLEDEEEKVTARPVKVNEPMFYGGYRFYQSDYDPKNPAYSGIGVSHKPGLGIVYFGFGVLFLGCFLMFYGRQPLGS